jgi:hypothetical protein
MKARAFVLTSIALTATAFAQLGGAVGTVTHTTGQVGRNGGNLAVGQTLNGTLDTPGGGQGSLAGDLNSTTDATANTDVVGKTKNKTKDVAGKTKDKTKQTVADTKMKSEQAVAETKAKTETVAQKSKDEAQQASSSVSADGKTAATTSTDAKKSDSSTSANTGVGVNANANVGTPAANLNASGDAEANGSVNASDEKKSDAAAANSNSGDDKQTGLDRAEERVDNATAQSKLKGNEAKQDARQKVSNTKQRVAPRKN